MSEKKRPFIQKFIASWDRMQSFPGGQTLFSALLGYFIPYTGSISSRIITLEPGHAIVRLRDRRKIRNGFRSIHALALANLGEFSTGLALFSVLNDNAQAIIVNINASYFKKARGTLTAEAFATLDSPLLQDSRYTLTALIKNEAHEVVCEVQATWQVRLTHTTKV